MPPSEAFVRINITYSFSEHIAILKQYARALNAQSPAPTTMASRIWRSRLVETIGIALLAPLVLLVKKLAVGSCTFEFTPEGIARHSRRGKSSRTWEQVERVRTLADAYMIELKEGVLPIPFRSFSEQQRNEFVRLLPAHLHRTDA